MKNLKISMKLLVGFLVIIFIVFVVGAIGVVGMTMLSHDEATLYREGVKGTSAISGMYAVIVEERIEVRGAMIDIDQPEEVKGYIDRLHTREEEFVGLHNDLLAAMPKAKDNALLTGAMDLYDGRYAELKDELVANLNSNDKEAAMAVYREIGPAAEQAEEALYNMMLEVDSISEDMKNRDVRMKDNLLIVQICIAVVGVIVALFMVFYLTKLISVPMGILTEFMEKAGTTGDITLRQEDRDIIGKYAQVKDEIGQCIHACALFVGHVNKVSDTLKLIAGGDLTASCELLSDQDVIGLSLRDMTSNLDEMFLEINEASNQVTVGSGQIADGSQSLAQGSTEQAASVQELSASMNEVAGKAKSNSDMAEEAAKMSNVIRENAEKGNDKMKELMRAVNEISEAGQSIEKINKVIDDIAFQTNILALNAAVEAARAGQYGKGFAVVAEEVRSLAAKSAEAANDTSELIENSMEKSNYGLSMADDTAKSLQDIVEEIKNNTEAIQHIAQSSDEQNNVITRVNMGISQISQVAQGNSATAEQSAAVSEELSSQAAILHGLVSRFKLKGGKAIGSSVVMSVPSANRLEMVGGQGLEEKY